jgi:splicing factor 3B subunit 3
MCHFHVRDLITNIHKLSLVAGRESFPWDNYLLPFVTKEDVDFISTLEQHLRTEQVSLVGRDHLTWRGYYVPVKAVADEDLWKIARVEAECYYRRVIRVYRRGIKEGGAIEGG